MKKGTIGFEKFIPMFLIFVLAVFLPSSIHACSDRDGNIDGDICGFAVDPEGHAGPLTADSEGVHFRYNIDFGERSGDEEPINATIREDITRYIEEGFAKWAPYIKCQYEPVHDAPNKLVLAAVPTADGHDGYAQTDYLQVDADGHIVRWMITFNSDEIYLLQDDNKKSGVFAHELGHCVGLGHVADESALMYGHSATPEGTEPINQNRKVTDVTGSD